MTAPASNLDLQPHVEALLARAGLCGPFTLEALPGAGNNRVLRVQLDKTSALLKYYFRHPGDQRDRLGSEYAFLSLAHQNGIRLVPRPLARDDEHGLGLYEFVEGRRLQIEEVTEYRVAEAAALFAAMNAVRHSAAAKELPSASEACFSLQDHLDCVTRRLKRLRELSSGDDADAACRKLVGASLEAAWSNVQSQVLARIAEQHWDLETKISEEQRRLSPSDFGFHNALLTANGSLRFVDFEYAGWDDPAKLICDFFCHPAMPVPRAAFELFREVVLADVLEVEAWRSRIALLMPVHRIKWCCIMLNEFLPTDRDRRAFSNKFAITTELKFAQLRKAEQYLERELINRETKGGLFAMR